MAPQYGASHWPALLLLLYTRAHSESRQYPLDNSLRPWLGSSCIHPYLQSSNQTKSVPRTPAEGVSGQRHRVLDRRYNRDIAIRRPAIAVGGDDNISLYSMGEMSLIVGAPVAAVVAHILW